MPSKKKPFLSKKDALTYHIVRRSQRDVGRYFENESGRPIDASNEFTLVPTSDTKCKLEEKDELRRSSAALLIAPTRSHEDGTNDEEDTDPDPLRKAKTDLHQAGLIDTCDYNSHLRSITGTGVYFSNITNAVASPNCAFNSSDGPRPSRLAVPPLDDNVREIERQFESIELNAACMADDIANALFGDFEDGDFEPILDDFCTAASKEPQDLEEDEYAKEMYRRQSMEGEFDFDTHVANLIDRVGEKDVMPKEHEWWKKTELHFSMERPLHCKGLEEEDSIDPQFNKYEEEEGLYGELHCMVPDLHSEEERVLCDTFEQTLAEYDSDDVGDLDEECDGINGNRELDDIRLDTAFDDFLERKTMNRLGEDCQITGDGKRMLYGGNDGNSGRQEEDGADGIADECQDQDQKEDSDEKLQVVPSKSDLAIFVNETLFDGKSYLSACKRNPWDCDSILSTYSNISNNPTIIGRSLWKRKKRGEGGGLRRNGNVGVDTISSLPEHQSVQHILLSNKTGMPAGVLPKIRTPIRSVRENHPFDYGMICRVNKGEARRKGEKNIPHPQNRVIN